MNNLVVYGTRPEEIKLYPFTKLPGYTFCEIDQSKDLHQGLINPDIKLDDKDDNFKTLMVMNKWDHVIVQGDTRTAFKAALAAFHAQIPVAHVEAGLRTWNLDHPFPEEGYRRMIDAIATHHFCPTIDAYNELAIPNGQVVGNTAIDTLLDFTSDPVEGKNILITIHRNEADVEPITNAIKKIIKYYPGLDFVFLAHPNKVSQFVASKLKRTRAVVVEAPNYKKFINMLARSYAVVTDSGGLQEEAPSLNKPVLVARETTEREEGIEAGCAILGGMSEDSLISGFNKMIGRYHQMAAAPNPYGDGKAAERIHEALSGCNNPNFK